MEDIELYMQDINRTPLLTAQEEHDLAVRMKGGDLSARDKLIEANLRLVVKVAFTYRNKGVELPDLIAEGNIALCKAVDKYDLCRGKLSTFLTHVVRNRILGIFKAHRYDLRPVSMNIRDETGRELGDSIKDDNDTDTDRMIEREAATKAKDLARHLNNRERKIVRMRFKERLTFREIGEDMHMSGENVRLLLNDALEKLRERMEDTRNESGI
ncbi:MAG TPA: hypothetical protein DET40_21765 [Lentisphaeria bacterium]|nr:hypothetical protein [Lentisphaeria bacterium]